MVEHGERTATQIGTLLTRCGTKQSKHNRPEQWCVTLSNLK